MTSIHSCGQYVFVYEWVFFHFFPRLHNLNDKARKTSFSIKNLTRRFAIKQNDSTNVVHEQQKRYRKGLECMFWRDSKKILSTTSCAKSPLVWVFLAFVEKRGNERCSVSAYYNLSINPNALRWCSAHCANVRQAYRGRNGIERSVENVSSGKLVGDPFQTFFVIS